jgi:hypothetical protein
MSKRGLAILLIAIAGGALWIEQGHRVVIDAPVAETAVAGAACSDTDAVPYSASCIAFMKGATETGMRWRATADPVFISVPQ